jgi:uncharacterized protein
VSGPDAAGLGDTGPDSAGLGSVERTTRGDLALAVADEPDDSRFTARAGGDLAAYAVYGLDGDDVVFTHTVTEDGWEGKGVGSTLVAAALDLVRAADRRVVPRCPFVADFIFRHEEYADLVDERHRRLVRARG